jgi:hypothetical protein
MVMRVTNIRSGTAALLLFLAATLVAEAQPSGKPYRIGYLSSLSPVAGQFQLDAPDALRQGLRDLGDVEGRTIVIEARWVTATTSAFRTWPRS